jgi:lipoprotein-releasing system permease protein
MMIVSVATGIGLQQKISRKVSAFNGHIIISNYDNNQLKLTPISKNQDPKFKTVPGVEHIQAISKAGIIRTETAFEGIILKELVLITSGTI